MKEEIVMRMKSERGNVGALVIDYAVEYRIARR